MFLQTEEARLVVAGLGKRRDGADLDVAEADLAEGMHGRSGLVEPGGKADAVGKFQSHHLDGRPDRVGGPARPCQTSQHAGRISRAHHREGDVVGFFGVQGEEETPRERIEIGHEDE